MQRQIAVADFNGDGILDLAIEGGGLSAPASLALLLGNGDGTFGNASYFSTGGDGSWISLALGDMNRDGNLDIVLSGNGASIVLFGGFRRRISARADSFRAGIWVTLGDFNHDGSLDIATAGGYFQGIYVLLNNGDGTFKTPVVYNGGNEPLDVAAGDFNHDGKLDLAVVATNDLSALILFGNGDGTFSPGAEFFVGFSPATLVVADFNQDGKLDLAISDYGQGTLSVMAGNGDGTFTQPIGLTTGNGPTLVAAADLNRDGSVDLIVPNNGDNTISVLLNAAGTSVLLKSSMNPSQVGHPVSITAKVLATVDTANFPSGMVTFRDGTTVLDTLPLLDGSAVRRPRSWRKAIIRLRQSIRVMGCSIRRSRWFWCNG